MRPFTGSLYDCTVLEDSQILKRKSMTIYIKVKPDSSELTVDTSKNMIEVELTEKADNARANTQLLDFIKQKTGEEASIKKGHKSRRKELRMNLSEEELRDKLEG